MKIVAPAVVFALAMVAASDSARAEEERIVACATAKHAFARDHCELIHYEASQHWVRGKASVNASTGLMRANLQLETDHMRTGPCGKMQAVFRDKDGKDLARMTMAKSVCIGGKGGGKARINNFPFQLILPTETASKVSTIVVAVERTGDDGISPPSLKDLIKVAGIIISVL